ncbi:sensor histidine kinase [Alkalibacterium pelagium]|uniref:histidine kinase n=1 Tax=Alkalibacterium pelagium TaxID=426702 RepID=A0A1H7K8M7_9LACT|nr:HAMP domain-containing sensor histidine kinase [Alkalibacterium pelagium]GEN50839.1 two-component sensor histidine kinase [Alkalibacterium pelagium]SEK82816.1 His Kinase A (phospho-acceptor) domain-containing protein [Alkalibacterium pelagium]
MQLTNKERLRLAFEAVVTAGIIFLCYFAVFEIVRWLVTSLPEVFGDFWLFGNMFDDIRTQELWGLTPLVFIFLIIVAGVAIYWRLKRRYHQYELQHIIKELHYIAQGNYTHRIRGKYSGDIGKVVDSIHVLVDSTVEAMEEERRIEQSKDELITNVSHDIRTPLTSIIGYLGLIEEGRFSSASQATDYVHTAYKKAKQMKALVDDLFEYTTVRQTTTPLEYIRFDMGQLIEQMAIDFELEAVKKGREIRTSTPEESIMMHGDTEKIVRVFHNLLSNALKYGKGGTLICINAVRSEDTVTVTVSNNGETLPEEAIEQLFERFYRAEASRSQETAGTGLGLAIAQSIVELHQGKISAEVKDGWTVFTVVLPLENEESQKQ